jgi:hypothetical protein
MAARRSIKMAAFSTYGGKMKDDRYWNARRSGYGGVTVTIRQRKTEKIVTVSANSDSIKESLKLIVDRLDSKEYQVLSCSTHQLNPTSKELRKCQGQIDTPQNKVY